MRLDLDDWVVLGLLALFVTGVALVVWAIVVDWRQWDSFRTEHHCAEVAQISGDVFNTIVTDSKGTVTVGIGTTPSKTGWLCDDGVTYYR